MISSLGANARAIAIGSVDGDTSPGTSNGPLDWNEFFRDLIVASHFTTQIGAYDLEGCVHKGFLPHPQNPNGQLANNRCAHRAWNAEHLAE